MINTFLTMQTLHVPMLIGQSSTASSSEELAKSIPGAFQYFVDHLNILTRPDELLQILNDVSPIWAGIFIVIGWICVVNGYRWHKTVLVLCSMLLGIGAGILIGEYMGSSVVLATCLGALFAVLAAPFLDYTVALFGALAGAYIGANIWSSISPESSLYWTGSVIGATSCAILAFVLFRFVVILFTSVAGSSLMAFGVLILMLQVDVWHDGLQTSMSGNPLLLPIIVGACSLISIVLQQGGGVVAVVKAKAPERTKAGKKPATA
ncbi:MAG TPA: TMEM198/TM7SF3 family protein [Phycisphaeraceae bacterium]|nr:TMEM198/TM7SF3 family protein [Phycisphaeraceae bacterium]